MMMDEPKEEMNMVLTVFLLIPLVLTIIATIYFIIAAIMGCVRGGPKTEKAPGLELELGTK